MTFDGSRFWIVSPDVLSSTDGTNWVRALTGFQTAAFAAGNGVMVLVGFYGLILTSNDGSNWVNQSAVTFDSITSMSYGNGRFVGTLSPGNFIVSSNASTWNVISTSNTNQLRKLVWAGNS